MGLRVAGVRRTPGLRREEVATLAGISADYYLRLEQGRDRNPSPPVLTALAKVLGLDATATSYLLSVAASRPARTQNAGRRQETVPASIRQLIGGDQPARVRREPHVRCARRQSAARRRSRRPSGRGRTASARCSSTRPSVISIPTGRRLSAAWSPSFRASIGPDADDPRTAQLVGELSLVSEPFSRLWARHDVRALAGGARDCEPPRGRAARALAGEAPGRRHRRPAPGDLLRRAGLGQCHGARASRLAGHRADRHGEPAERAATAATLSGPASAGGATGARSRAPRRR